MARIGLRVARGAVVMAALLLCVTTALSAVASDPPDTRKANQLALQAALEEGLEHLAHGHYREAVLALEKQLALIDGNRRYLMALRDAYRGYIQELRQAGQEKEAKTYQEFLAILEPSTRKRPAPDTPAAAPAKTASVQSAEKQPPGPTKLEQEGIIGRGKIDDPFDELDSGSRKGPHGAKAVATSGVQSLLRQAESEFSSRRYARACQLYERAERAEPGIARASKGKWAYCRMFCVAKALNEQKGELTNPEELQHEVQQALKMAPNLEGFARKLLEQIKADALQTEVKVEVKHTPRQGSGWAVAETANFRIFHAQSPQDVEKAARIVETMRVRMSLKWLGEKPGPWSPRCDLYLHPTAKSYMLAPGTPPSSSPGHSTITLDSGRVLARRIDARCDDPHMLSAVLPHETTHVVLAGHFGQRHLPRWADEGMAVLSEPRERIALYLDHLPRKPDDTLLGTGQLLSMTGYPEARRIGGFYAQSISLVEFLCRKKGPRTFALFLREGLESGYEGAVRHHYGYQNLAELDRDWQQHVFGEGTLASEG
jgi:tetratricopeptide (TPR) repeat protein